MLNNFPKIHGWGIKTVQARASGLNIPTLGRPNLDCFGAHYFLALLGHNQATLKRKLLKSICNWCGQGLLAQYCGLNFSPEVKRPAHISYKLIWATSSSGWLSYDPKRPKNSEHQIDHKLGRPSIHHYRRCSTCFSFSIKAFQERPFLFWSKCSFQVFHTFIWKYSTVATSRKIQKSRNICWSFAR